MEAVLPRHAAARRRRQLRHRVAVQHPGRLQLGGPAACCADEERHRGPQVRAFKQLRHLANDAVRGLRRPTLPGLRGRLVARQRHLAERGGPLARLLRLGDGGGGARLEESPRRAPALAPGGLAHLRGRRPIRGRHAHRGLRPPRPEARQRAPLLRPQGRALRQAGRLRARLPGEVAGRSMLAVLGLGRDAAVHGPGVLRGQHRPREARQSRLLGLGHALLPDVVRQLPPGLQGRHD
mmetsp:Transcript_107533/g.301143  ORF Transcript_107533/g.301143 Transcript_107533/m.301143 type:complete len:237 (+) Transcript_107533:193-903(+)